MENEILESLSGITNEFFQARSEIEQEFCLKAEVWAERIIEELNSKGRNLEIRQTTWDEDDGFRFLTFETNGEVKQSIIFTEYRLAQELSRYR